MSYDVIIVGCGPVGAVAANLLGQYGHRVLVLEQFADAFPLPRAVHIDHEMMRLFQNMGLVEQMLPLMRETEGHMHLGADGDVIRYMGSKGKPKRFGWANDYFFYQPELEAVLRRAMTRFDHVEFRQGVKVDSITQSDAGCRVGAGDEIFTARFVIACDGARSPVRSLLGIDLFDFGFEEAWLVVDANVEGPISFPPIPSLPAEADVQQLSVMTCDPKRPATIVPGRGAHRRWEFMLLPGESEAAIVEPEAIQALVGPWLRGCTWALVRTATYRFHARIAKAWRQGNVFLAGDAAHQTPPFFGQGMCHGLRDVGNLAFKLDLVLRGRAGEAVLDTYQAERDPQVRHVIGAAVAAGRYICELDPTKAATRDTLIRERQRSGQDIATAADLIAAYGTGLVADGAGERFVQPRIDGVLLDDLTGRGFRLLGASNGLSAAGEAVIAQLDIICFNHHDLTPVLAGHAAVLIRPDNYVYGWAADAAALDALLVGLAQQLTPALEYLNA
jgi:3-(3-hydroxy-phenyl)propionate hydroxylase